MRNPRDDNPQDEIVIVGAARTPTGRFLGSLSKIAAPQLGAHAIRGALGEFSGERVDAVIMGEVLQAGVGQNPAKQAALAAGITPQAHTLTVNKVCLSGLTAVIDAARLLRSREADVVVAGGMESMSQSPHLLPRSRFGLRYGDAVMLDHLAHDGLRAADLDIAMGELSERYADRYPVSREEQDEFSVLSHQRALAAHQDGVFAQEIIELEGLSQDEGVRENVSVESLSKLRPAFTPDGSITAGNASQLSDGAAALMLCRREFAEAEGLKIMAVVRAPGQVAGPDSSLQHQPARALEQALKRQGWEASDLDAIEINEAFAAVAVYSARELGIDWEKVNQHGGAIAMGHPIGASGARLAAHVAHQIAAGKLQRAGAALCGGGGQGEALLFEASA